MFELDELRKMFQNKNWIEFLGRNSGLHSQVVFRRCSQAVMVRYGYRGDCCFISTILYQGLKRGGGLYN